MTDGRQARLWKLLSDVDCRALVVVARSSEDPNLAPFLDGGRPRRCRLIAPVGEAPRLGYDSPMEREEAAASGLSLIPPEDVEPAAEEGESGGKGPRSPGERLGAVLVRSLRACGVPSGRVAVAGRFDVGAWDRASRALVLEGWQPIEGELLVSRWRRSKSVAELEEIDRVVAAMEGAFRRVAEILAASSPDGEGVLWVGSERLRVRRLRDEIARLFASGGWSQPEGNIVAPGPQGAIPHTGGSDERVLRAGESLVVDLFPRGRLFGDATRTFCVGTPPERLRRGVDLVRDALRRAESRVAVGVSGWSLQEEVCRGFEAEGIPTLRSCPSTERGYVHGLGHGVGHELHELPSFRKDSGEDGVLCAGDVFTLEPGLYEPEDGWAVRLEDMYHLGADGPVRLTRWPREVDPRVWS